MEIIESLFRNFGLCIVCCFTLDGQGKRVSWARERYRNRYKLLKEVEQEIGMTSPIEVQGIDPKSWFYQFRKRRLASLDDMS